MLRHVLGDPWKTSQVEIVARSSGRGAVTNSKGMRPDAVMNHGRRMEILPEFRDIGQDAVFLREPRGQRWSVPDLGRRKAAFQAGGPTERAASCMRIRSVGGAHGHRHVQAHFIPDQSLVTGCAET